MQHPSEAERRCWQTEDTGTAQELLHDARGQREVSSAARVRQRQQKCEATRLYEHLRERTVLYQAAERIRQEYGDTGAAPKIEGQTQCDLFEV